jgi:hypothetical protein
VQLLKKAAINTISEAAKNNLFILTKFLVKRVLLQSFML